MPAQPHSIPTPILQRMQLPRNGRLGENNPARGGIDSRNHAERNRKILSAMPRLDAIQHRASKSRGLLGGEARYQLRLLLVSVNRANRAKHNSRYAAERARLPQLHQHPVYSIRLLARIFQEKNSPIKARLERRANHRDHYRQASSDHLALRVPRMHRLASLELEAVYFAAQQTLQVFEGARTQTFGKIHRDHRPVKRYHPGKIDERVEQERRVRETNEYFWRLRHRLEVENGQQPPASVTAARGKNRLDLGIGEIFLKLARTVSIVARQNPRTGQHALRDLHAKAHRGEYVDAALEMLPFDRCG